MSPSEFQDRLTYLGGKNRYDDPNFRLWWGQYAYGDGSFRSGGVWTVDEAPYIGYRDVLRGSGEPCWCLGQWFPPECYGTPASFYLDNLDEPTGLQILGEFPYSGRVELLYNLRFSEIINGKIEFWTMPLNTTTFDLIIPVIIAAKNVSIEKRRAAIEDARQKGEEAKTAQVERHLRERDIPFKSAVSYTRQGIRSTIIDKRALEMRARWNDLTKAAKQFRKGIQTR